MNINITINFKMQKPYSKLNFYILTALKIHLYKSEQSVTI